LTIHTEGSRWRAGNGDAGEGDDLQFSQQKGVQAVDTMADILNSGGNTGRNDDDDDDGGGGDDGHPRK
jgi:hypothetical protein